MRQEKDSIGTAAIPADAYYGIHTQRAHDNFPISETVTHPGLIRGLIEIKLAAAKTNVAAGDLPEEIGAAIEAAAEQLLDGPFDEDMFPISDIQGGAGTSTNMNVNEVIANLALELAGFEKGDYSHVHPNDHLNMCQSTNDTYPTAGKIALIRLLDPLLGSLSDLVDALADRAAVFSDTYKMGRTQLQDAVPMVLGNSFHSWLAPLKRDIKRIKASQESLHTINLGGSAIGSGINVSAYYNQHIADNLSAVTGLDLVQAEDLFDATVNQDALVTLSGALKTLAVNLSKMANDLRLMSSGPRSGLGEINLPAKQAGSSIMPGKVNPVIPEAVSQVAFEVIGFDATVTAAAEAGQFELNAFEPIMFKSLITGIEHLTAAMDTLRTNAIEGITANKEKLAKDVEMSISYATAMAPIIGYQEASKLAKASLKSGTSLRKMVEGSRLFTDEQLDHIFNVHKLVINARTPEHGLIFGARTVEV
ncbi:aspartate ammonia-lyase [Lactobacillaceae bacterium L1_55_11]|nr:aspartate ammonia-lyase [Lactobacillaceae bacterium L1_55_11]